MSNLISFTNISNRFYETNSTFEKKTTKDLKHLGDLHKVTWQVEIIVGIKTQTCPGLLEPKPIFIYVL